MIYFLFLIIKYAFPRRSLGSRWSAINRVAVLGNCESGKSTLIGVFTQNELENGRGKARLNLLRHLHEVQAGHTSLINHEILGFNNSGQGGHFS